MKPLPVDVLATAMNASVNAALDATEIQATGVAVDSRDITPGDVFCALEGSGSTDTISRRRRSPPAPWRSFRTEILPVSRVWLPTTRWKHWGALLIGTARTNSPRR